ncbi:MAG: ATP-binding cassette domain-containing protein [Bacilli bacterium]|nr:ATP-binding cassette domain-containing protein [Bacilli bacterium]
MIEVDNVSKKFTKQIDKKHKETFYADKSLTLRAKEGEILGILGPNGAGKTTLLRMLAGLLTPDEGVITIDKEDYKTHGVDIKRKISYLSGNTHLYKDLSPYELLTMCAEYYGMPKNEIAHQIERVEKKFDLTPILHQRIGSLSTGQLQRVNIARTTIHNPEIYIFDEATSGLDIIASKVILDFIKEEREKNKTIVYSTHYMEEAENICDRVVLIHRGEIVAEGTPESIIKKTNTTNLRDAFFKIIKEDQNA